MDDEDEYFMEDEESLEDKRAIYAAQGDDANITKKTVIDRILGQDWVLSLDTHGQESSRWDRLMVEEGVECAAGCDAGYAVFIPLLDGTEMGWL